MILCFAYIYVSFLVIVKPRFQPRPTVGPVGIQQCCHSPVCPSVCLSHSLGGSMVCPSQTAISGRYLSFHRPVACCFHVSADDGHWWRLSVCLSHACTLSAARLSLITRVSVCVCVCRCICVCVCILYAASVCSAACRYKSSLNASWQTHDDHIYCASIASCGKTFSYPTIKI